MNANCRMLVDALSRPETTLQLEPRRWDRLLRVARGAGILPRLAVLLRDLCLTDQLPSAVQSHLHSAEIVALSSRRMLRWETNRIARALRSCDFPIVLLKGAAYESAGLPPRLGRNCADIDVLVPLHKLAETERLLANAGWEVAELSNRHERYFRTWLHELPPLKHRDRHTLLDVHHTILPLTDTLPVDPQKLLDNSQPVRDSKFHVLAPEDMVIHSAIHLFRNGKFYHGLRDLHDLDGLLRHFGAVAGFGDRLARRVQEFGVTSPCYFAFRSIQELFHTPLTTEVQALLTLWQPAWPQPPLMATLLKRALAPHQLDAPDVGHQRAIQLLAYWPLPRLRAIISPLFWSKRWHSKGRAAL